ncbi:Exocyst complex component 5 [Homalodisca vitripennis]|nr:Exocyst complex component 5 [Homalodisca vitripennis]
MGRVKNTRKNVARRNKDNIAKQYEEQPASLEPFDPEEFVERLAWRTVDSNREEGNSTFDPVLMHETFSQAIK